MHLSIDLANIGTQNAGQNSSLGELVGAVVVTSQLTKIKVGCRRLDTNSVNALMFVDFLHFTLTSRDLFIVA